MSELLRPPVDRVKKASNHLTENWSSRDSSINAAERVETMGKHMETCGNHMETMWKPWGNMWKPWGNKRLGGPQ